MKKLPIGIQTFSEIINENYLYVDKTQEIAKLLNGKYYFLSRPRRFGKSLTISTLEQIFLGNQELFKDLWIYDKIEWTEFPIIRIDFSPASHKLIGLENTIISTLKNIAEKYNIIFVSQDYSSMFRELIVKISKEKRVVILIDEYDKPIIDFVDDLEQAKKNRDILKNFYSVIKGADQNIRFLFITGVSKFSQVSIFSDLNNLNDITIGSNFANLVGYTQTELDFYFKEGFENLELKYKDVFPDIKQVVKEWYNGYSWDAENFVYNPFSILNLFYKNILDNYWFKTGTPTFLIKLIEKNNYDAFDLENINVNTAFLDKYDIENIELISLLMQTGYLTVKQVDIKYNIFTLNYPNREVAESFSNYLITSFNKNTHEKNSILLNQLIFSILKNDLVQFIETIKSIFANITYPNIDNKEKYYHSIFYLTLKLLGFNIESEVLTIDGRIDAVLQTDTHIYVIEFKISTAKTAMKQLKTKNYHQKYMNQSKSIVLLAIGFNMNEKKIGDYLIENVKK